ncbi:unnamed protein product [Coregonus sp. 'balchen']|nr:unnamed protein product [Coregonus sp. 'balchen']
MSLESCSVTHVAKGTRRTWRFPGSKIYEQLKRQATRSIHQPVLLPGWVLGWLLIASIMVFNLLLICVARCNSPVSYLQLKFWRAYAQRESDLLESYTADHAEKLAERNLKSFFQQMPPDPVTTPPNQAWEKISSLYRFSTRDHYYSILHKYVETCHDPAEARDHRMSSVRSDTANPAALAFVDEGKMML